MSHGVCSYNCYVVVLPRVFDSHASYLFTYKIDQLITDF